MKFNCRGIVLLLTRSLQQRIVPYRTEHSRETLEHQNLPLAAARPPAHQGEAVWGGSRLLTGFLLARRQHWEGDLSMTAILSPMKPGPYPLPGTNTVHITGVCWADENHILKIFKRRKSLHLCQTICPISPLSSRSSCIIFCCSHYKHFLNNMGSKSLKSHT